ncbi:MAG: hypothetical protein HY670_08310, partial [Chloroflexi bacterium]|nr:hypothetical protein [Chloroflexota bacterium]
FQRVFTAPSWRTFAYLACGWTLTTDRHTITTSVWLTGASTVKHFSRFSVFLGCPLYDKRWQLWGAVIRMAAQFVPQGEVIRVAFDETTKKKAGTHIEGLDRYRNGAGSARQEYRTLRGVNVVVGIMCIPLTRWPGHSLSVPVGLELYLKVDMEIRDANAFNGLGHEQCRKRQRILGVNTFRLVMAAARTLWFLDQVERSTTFTWCRYRPWYRQKVAPSQLDVVWACREALQEAGIFPIPRFIPDLAENHEEPEHALPLVA